jgi:tungstate transport system ATP-binding protein
MSMHAAGLVKRYDGATVLSLDELTIDTGGVHVVVGPNGSGKTTFLRLIAGIEQPDAGELKVLGEDWRQARAKVLALRRRLGFAAQKPYLFRTTVRRNVEYPARARGMGGNEAAKRASAAMERLGVAHLADRSARTLSSGEARRVSIARAVAVEPELLLLDEPLANVDAQYTRVIESLITELAGRGTTMLVATHVQDLAYHLSAAVVRMEHGRLVPPAIENLLEGELADSDKEGEAILMIDAGPSLEIATERRGRVRAAIEPKDIVVSVEELHSSARNHLRGTVTALEDRGTVVHLTADVGVPLVVTVTHQSLADLHLTVGTPVYLTFKATAVKVF